MASSVNKVILVGNLGKGPDLKSLQNGSSVCKFSIAMNEKFKGRDGQMQERVEWANIVVWGKSGEACANYLDKGSRVYVEGALRTRSYEKDGETRYITEVQALNVVFLSTAQGDGGGNGNRGGNSSGGGNRSRSNGGSRNQPPPEDDDVPF